MQEKALLATFTIIPTLIMALTLFISGKERVSSNRILGGLFFVIVLLTISSILLSDFKYMQFFPVAHLLNLTIMLLGPLFYMYVKSCLEKRFCFKKRYLAYFLPFLFIFLIFLYQTVFHDVFYGKHTNQFVYKTIETIQNAIFFVLVPFIAVKNNVSLRDFLFNFRNMRLTWIRFLFFSLLVIWINKLVITLGYDIHNNANFYLLSLSLYFLFSGCFLTIALFVIMNRDRFLFPRDRYGISPLSDNDKDRYFKRLKSSMQNDKPFLDLELTLSSLSRATGIPVKALSQTINEMSGRNFNDFINTYRIEYACRLLKEKSGSSSILDILYEAGFNSKSVFNRAFKKMKGVTPREYKDSNA